MTDYADARKSLELTVRYLEKLNPSAAASLKEGPEETLTVHRLGVSGLLRKTVSTTNPIESCFSVTRSITGRVKRWRGGDMGSAVGGCCPLESRKEIQTREGLQGNPEARSFPATEIY